MRVRATRSFGGPSRDKWIELPGVKCLMDDGTMRVRGRTAFFKTNGNVHCLPPGEGDVVGEVTKYLELLRGAMDPIYSDGVSDWQPKVGIAGSAALCLVERMMSRDSEGRLRGRWNKEVVGLSAPYWSPNDVDVFFCGRPGQRKAAFRAAVKSIKTKLGRSVSRMGKKLIVEKEFEHKYTSRTDAFLIQNIRIEGMSLAMSFIQVPKASSVAEAVEQFDLDIVKVVCNVHTQELCLPVDTVSRIWIGKAEVMDFVTKQHYPSAAEERALVSTFKRMRKYGDRGYRYARYFSIRSEAAEKRRKKVKEPAFKAYGGYEWDGDGAPVSDSEGE